MDPLTAASRTTSRTGALVVTIDLETLLLLIHRPTLPLAVTRSGYGQETAAHLPGERASALGQVGQRAPLRETGVLLPMVAAGHIPTEILHEGASRCATSACLSARETTAVLVVCDIRPKNAAQRTCFAHGSSQRPAQGQGTVMSLLCVGGRAGQPYAGTLAHSAVRRGRGHSRQRQARVPHAGRSRVRHTLHR